MKNSVYVLPKNDQTLEDFQWVLREIVEGGGEASVCEARFVEGLSDDQVQSLFQIARDADYSQIAEEARHLLETLPADRKIEDDQRAQLDTELVRLKRRLGEIVAIDFFDAPGRLAAEGLIQGLESRLVRTAPGKTAVASAQRLEDFRSRIWVTRKGIHIDRMASAWLIRRFIDPEARFKFVSAKGYRPEPGELRFDMFEAEFTHEGDQCTFEVLLHRLGMADPALRPIAEMVHDIDLKDSKFGRQETAGIERLIAGIAMAYKDDETRLCRAAAVFDDLYEYFKKHRG